MASTPLIKPMPDQQFAIDKFADVDACLIGDSMGVGKTVTAIGRDFQLRGMFERPGATLIITEKNGLDVWDYHLTAMGVPSDDIIVVDPSDKRVFVNEVQSLQNGITTRKYFIVHWDVIARMEVLYERRGLKGKGLPKIKWFHVIADEAHLAKNRKAQRTIALKTLSCRYKTACTGTPSDDKPQDIWSLLHWLYPSEYSAYWKFVNEYVEQEIDPFRGYRKLLGPIKSKMRQFHSEIDPFYIRRTLLDVAPNMPKKVHVRPITTVALTARQRRMYDQMEEFGQTELGGDIDYTLLSPYQVSTLQRLQMLTLGTIETEFSVDDYEAWDKAMQTLIDSDADGEEIIKLEKKEPKPKVRIVEPSPKLDAIMDMIKTNENESFIVFSQFRDMVDLIENRCRRDGISVVKITGDVTKKSTRTERVKQFQSGTARVFTGTIGAAGRVITLTKAHHVLFADRSWNPSKNQQAEDRAWRRTQDGTVFIHDFEAEDTYDQVRREQIDEKGQWIQTMLTPPKA